MPKKKANRTKPHPKAKATTRAAPLEVESISAGDGETRPSAGDELTVHYVGQLLSDGSEFDSSRAKDEPFTFVLGKGSVIRGWELAMPQLSLGETAKLTIAAEMAYGAKGCVDKEHASGTGVIPPHADLVFVVELLDINGCRAVAALHKYSKMLHKWVAKQLAKFDTDEGVRGAKTAKYGGRESYAAFLEQSRAAKYEQERAKRQKQPQPSTAATAAGGGEEVTAAAEGSAAAREARREALEGASAEPAPSVDSVHAAAGKKKEEGGGAAAVAGGGGQAQEGEGQKGARQVGAFDQSFAAIKVDPNPGEERDRNFPRNLHNAAELLMAVGHVDGAKKLHSATTRMLSLLAAGPDGKTAQAIGRACVCWGCGHVGIPSNATDTPDYPGTAPAGVCAECGEAAQTNFVRVMQGQGTGSTSVPWMEMRGVATEEAQRAAAAMDE